MRFGFLLSVLLLCSLALNAYLLLAGGSSQVIVSSANTGSLNVFERLKLGAAARVENDNGLDSLTNLRDRSGNSVNDNLGLASEGVSADNVNALFEAGDFVAAVQGWRWLESNDSSVSLQLKSDWLLMADLWLEESALDKVQGFVDAWLNAYPYDLELRHLQAKSLAAAGEHLAAIEQYYALMTDGPAARQGIYARNISELVDKKIEQLSEQQAWQPMIRFLERLLWHEPQHPPYILMLAKAHIELAQFGSASSLLQTIKYDEYYGARAKALLKKIELKNLRAVSVALTPQREHYLVAGTIDDRQAVSLMIDTGASISVLSTRYFSLIEKQVSPSFVRMASINTAGGKVKAPIYQFDSFSIDSSAADSYRLSEIQFVVMDLDEKTGGDGLLGMNFLRAFKFQIDQRNNLLLLQPR